MSPSPSPGGPPSFSLIARPAARPRLGLFYAVLSNVGAVAAALSPFALVGVIAAIAKRSEFDPDAMSGWLQLVLGACLIAVSLVVAFGAHAFFRTRFERALQRRHQPLADWTDLDGRFALLLRTFRDDRRKILLWSVRVQSPFDLTAPWERLELQIVRAFRPLMPVITVGRPSEPLPQLGARRFYVSNDDWREAVLYALGRCAAVVIVVGPGEGLRWEISQTLRHTPPDGALFLFPLMRPRSPNLLGRFGLGVRRRALQEQEQRYEAFVAELQAAGVAGFPPHLDGQQAVLFRQDGRSTPLGETRPRGTLFKPLFVTGIAALAAMILGAEWGLEATPLVFIALLWFGAVEAMRLSQRGSFDDALKRAVGELQADRPSQGED